MLRNMVSDLDFIAYEVIHPQMSPAKQMEYLSINWGKENSVVSSRKKGR